MNKSVFYKWLKIIKKLDDMTCNAQISNCLIIEESYGDLDDSYARDKCESIFPKLSYTEKEDDENIKVKNLFNSLKLYEEFKENKLVQEIKDMPDVDPDKYDGSYELVRETVESFSRTPIDVIDVSDLDVLYFMTVGTWKVKAKYKIQKIQNSHLPIEEKKRLTKIFNLVMERARKHEYENIVGEWSVGMFSIGFYTFTSKSDEDSARRFISLCIKIHKSDDENEILHMAEETFKTSIKGMQAMEASVILHCLKPYIFPIINTDTIEDYVLFEEKGVIFTDPKELTNYVENTRKIKKFRDKECLFRNYKVLDMKLLSIERMKIDKSKYSEIVPNRDVVNEEDLEISDCSKSTYSKEDFLNEIFMEEGQYDVIYNLLRHKKNIILKGPSGVGKTFIARKFVYSIMEQRDDARVKMIQFHEEYSYEDFVIGYRPGKDGFRLKYGIFYRFCKQAESDPRRPYYFIIDEIDRGNLSKIFGEVIMLVEADKRGEEYAISLPYIENLFYIPRNVYIIGTMTARKGNSRVFDCSLRRRFAFIEIEPAFNNLNFKRYMENKNEDLADSIIEKFIKLNEDIENDPSLGGDFRIGHSYFCTPKHTLSKEKYRNIIQYEILPQIAEYWTNEPYRIKKWIKELIE
ncbi:AAA family ATPase [Clostridium ljungdahlii]|uniref:5-methylcytosine-specific restriction enzyme B n=1 Tax=Clostridium ljungdahlii TaxID=1538 RepID=A0A170NJ51_9CLOT|nr:AAA family ATPase [Clostridium ljungdahlii]OAA90220.1 5-methylcytosine-specific restriction enzyme B [Clostridium ljungdahlii]